jgi:hypothetical protein
MIREIKDFYRNPEIIKRRNGAAYLMATRGCSDSA